MKLMPAGLLITTALVLTSSQLLASNLKTDIDKESYSMGVSTGQYIGNQIVRQDQLGLKVDVDLVVDGFVDALQNKVQLKEEDVIQYLNNRAKKLNEAQENEIKELIANNKKKEQEFLAKNKTKSGVIETKSGLQYEIIAKGKGPKTKPESILTANYKASLVDGYVFEENLDKAKPVNLSMISVIEGLREGLMLMTEGSKFKFYIPSKLAYGEKQTAEIAPHSTLIFEVEVYKVLKPSDFREKEKFEIMMEEKEKNSKFKLEETK